MIGTGRGELEKPRSAKRAGMWASLQFHDFRLLWTGLLVSNLGSWMQLTATGYYIAKAAHSTEQAALYLGFQGLARAVPVILVSPIAGVLADTFPRRRLLFITNGATVILALTLAVLTSLGWMTVALLIGISALQAVALSFDSPARQSWVPLLVGREYVGNAIGLNSIAFNAPAVVGPAIAGVLIAAIGIEGSFYANAVATTAVLVALAFMKSAPPSTSTRGEPILRSILDGLRFLTDHRILRWIIALFVVTALLARPYSMLLPAYVVNGLHANAKGLGIAISATGIGGFAGALLTAYLGSRERRGVLWLASAAVMCVGVLSLGFISKLWISLPVLFAIGAATLTFLGASNTLIQTLSPDVVRGRAISVYTMVAIGVVPAGAFVLGALANFIGLHHAFLVSGGLCALLVLWLWLSQPIVRTV
ncbi:MAG: MFS transporter [Candidatus Eremiobacteraeota bacterium]|nr:MFS transporter [Candidatus Eremiobacteraeota bacterium]